MADRVSKQARSENMRRITSSDTRPELVVRRLLHGMGYRYRLHRKDLPGKPDIVLGPRQKAIFVHGCFWHQHAACRAGRIPGSNSQYWVPKLRRNVERDALTQQALAAGGWEVLVIWECQIKDRAGLADTLRSFIERESGSRDV